MKNYKLKRLGITFFLFVIIMTLGLCSSSKDKKGYEYFPDMAYTGPHDDAGVYEAYDPNKNFKNLKTTQQPVAGTIPRGHLTTKFPERGALFTSKAVLADKKKSSEDDDYDSKYNAQSGLYALSRDDMTGKRVDAENAGKTLTNPIPYSIKALARGKQLYYRNCYPCHGMGRQKGQVALTNGMLMGPDLSFPQYKAYPEGRMYYIISEGNSTMPGYSTQISPKDRWNLVHYIQYSIQNKAR